MDQGSVRHASGRSRGPRRRFVRGGAARVGTHNRGTEHRIFAVGTAALSPAADAAVHMAPVAMPCGQISPQDPAAIAMEHRLDGQVLCAAPTLPTWPSRRFLIRSHWLSRSPKRRIGQPCPAWRVSAARPGNSGLSLHALDVSPQPPGGDAISPAMRGRLSRSSLPDTMAPARGRVEAECPNWARSDLCVTRLGAQRPQRVRRMQIARGIALLVAISSPKRGRAPVC
jgi:hypothetical protein